MIEKLDTKMEYVKISIAGNEEAECLDFAAGRKLNLKINELVDAVNAIQKEREAERFEIQEWIGILEAVRESVNIHEKQIDELQMKVEPEKCEAQVDPYEEQRKWIGKLCRFWDTNIGENVWGILGGIDFSENEKYPYWCDQLQEQYQNCEPVKTDDDIIYKGENNVSK